MAAPVVAETKKKKAYKPSVLTVYGSVAEMTRGGSTGGLIDGAKNISMGKTGA